MLSSFFAYGMHARKIPLGTTAQQSKRSIEKRSCLFYGFRVEKKEKILGIRVYVFVECVCVSHGQSRPRCLSNRVHVCETF